MLFVDLVACYEYMIQGRVDSDLTVFSVRSDYKYQIILGLISACNGFVDAF